MLKKKQYCKDEYFVDIKDKNNNYKDQVLSFYSRKAKEKTSCFFDVDGVIKVGNEPIKKRKEAIELIR